MARRRAGRTASIRAAGLQDLGGRGLNAFLRIRDHELDAAQPTPAISPHCIYTFGSTRKVVRYFVFDRSDPRNWMAQTAFFFNKAKNVAALSFQDTRDA